MGDFCRFIRGSTKAKTQVKTLKIYDRQQIKSFICNLNVYFFSKECMKKVYYEIIIKICTM